MFCSPQVPQGDPTDLQTVWNLWVAWQVLTWQRNPPGPRSTQCALCKVARALHPPQRRATPVSLLPAVPFPISHGATGLAGPWILRTLNRLIKPFDVKTKQKLSPMGKVSFPYFWKYCLKDKIKKLKKKKRNSRTFSYLEEKKWELELCTPGNS